MIPLPLLSTTLRKRGNSNPPGYRKLYTMITSGQLPGFDQYLGRWYTTEEALPAIESRLGLKRSAPEVRP